MTFTKSIRGIWKFLKEDTWFSWFVSIILIIAFIKLIFFPSLSFITGTSLPLVVVESCSMYHESDFEEWWQSNRVWYESKDISLGDFESFKFGNGLNKGDIIFVMGVGESRIGDVIIFEGKSQHPIIHRIVELEPISTKGDHNVGHLLDGSEENIDQERLIGRAVLRIPFLGWVKLIFFEPFRSPRDRGFCK